METQGPTSNLNIASSTTGQRIEQTLNNPNQAPFTQSTGFQSGRNLAPGQFTFNAPNRGGQTQFGFPSTQLRSPYGSNIGLVQLGRGGQQQFIPMWTGSGKYSPELGYITGATQTWSEAQAPLPPLTEKPFDTLPFRPNELTGRSIQRMQQQGTIPRITTTQERIWQINPEDAQRHGALFDFIRQSNTPLPRQTQQQTQSTNPFAQSTQLQQLNPFGGQQSTPIAQQAQYNPFEETMYDSPQSTRFGTQQPPVTSTSFLEGMSGMQSEPTGEEFQEGYPELSQQMEQQYNKSLPYTPVQLQDIASNIQEYPPQLNLSEASLQDPFASADVTTGGQGVPLNQTQDFAYRQGNQNGLYGQTRRQSSGGLRQGQGQGNWMNTRRQSGLGYGQSRRQSGGVASYAYGQSRRNSGGYGQTRRQSGGSRRNYANGSQQQGGFGAVLGQIGNEQFIPSGFQQQRGF